MVTDLEHLLEVGLILIDAFLLVTNIPFFEQGFGLVADGADTRTVYGYSRHGCIFTCVGSFRGRSIADIKKYRVGTLIIYQSLSIA